MKAVIIPHHGGAEVLSLVRDFARPDPSPGEVLVRVRATTVNQMDLLVRNGYPNRVIPLPHIPGGDVAGTVERCGDGVHSVKAGARVVVYPLISCGKCSLCTSGKENICANWQTVGIHRWGGYAEYVCIPERNVMALPENLPFDVAATLPVAGLTAHHAIVTVGKLAAGELAVVWGAAGGLGSMAVQIAKTRGARVAAVVGTAAHAAAAEKIGADFIIDRSKSDVAGEIKKIEPEGADLVFDVVGAPTFPTSLSLLKNGGRLLCCGILGGRETPLNIHTTYFHHLSVHGLFLGTRSDMEGVMALAATGAIHPLIDQSLPLEEAVRAQRIVETGQQAGKIVLIP
ncbi:MAG TPA: zinc-binding dehydrogenase [Spirochaetia bacterium]|nr:zinc-binding dehydrogenase [Spirochaetia bacterium]